MKSLTEYLWFNTPKRRDLLNITDQIEQLVARSGVSEGFCLEPASYIRASRVARTRPCGQGATTPA